MAKRGGYPGGMPSNMGNIMKQAQRMQKQMEEATAALEEKTYEATSGGGAVKVVVNGKKEMESLVLDEAIVDPEDIETLQDAIIVAVNEAYRKMEEDSQKEMSKITGNMGGMGGFPF